MSAWERNRTDWWGEPAATDRDVRRAREIVTNIERDAPWLGGPFHVHQTLAERIALALTQERAAERERVLAPVRALVEELDREGVTQLFDGPHNWNGHITARIRAVLPPADTEDGQR